MQNASAKQLFDPSLRSLKDRRALHIAKDDANFLSRIAVDIMADRLDAVARRFPIAVDLLSRFDDMENMLSNAPQVDEVRRLGGLSPIAADSQTHSIAAFNNGVLNLEPESVNLVTSVFGLHWMNDLPGVLQQIRLSLLPDGLFMATLPGDQTLNELRQCFIEAEADLYGSASLRVDPFGEVRQYGELLQRAGFTLPVVDTDSFTIRYGSLSALVADLRAMGATSSLAASSRNVSATFFELVEKLYFERFADEDGRIRATVEIVNIIGWTPHESQQKPIAPGSAKMKLGDVL